MVGQCGQFPSFYLQAKGLPGYLHIGVLNQEQFTLYLSPRFQPFNSINSRPVLMGAANCIDDGGINPCY
jgi:hypothetical protein